VHNDLPLEEWLLFFRELGEANVMYLIFGGGEPLIRSDMPQLIEGAVAARMRFQILSNGTLLTDEIAAFITSTHYCHGFQISIDGAQPTSHEIFRGKGTFNRVIRGLEILNRHGIPVHARVTIHKGNVHELIDIARFLLVDLEIPSFSINSAVHMGKCRQNSSSIQLDNREYTLAMQTLLFLDQQYPGRIKAISGPLADVKRVLMVWNNFDAEEENLHGGGFLSGCHAAWDKIGVRADGIFVPCIQLSHIELGGINKDRLQHIWQTHQKLEQLRKRMHIPLTNFEECKDCPYISICTGNCPALAYTRFGELDRPSPDGCLRRLVYEYECIVKKLQLDQ